MAAVRIEISEIVTGLGLFGYTDSRAALRSAMAGRCPRLPRLPPTLRYDWDTPHHDVAGYEPIDSDD
ncbi:MAG: hypothetical protein OXH78_08675 [Acidimicrobiaceae bacterium]|nr:hypothetical protein [Acidimicrobiaceae bacterium]